MDFVWDIKQSLLHCMGLEIILTCVSKYHIFQCIRCTPKIKAVVRYKTKIEKIDILNLLKPGQVTVTKVFLYFLVALHEQIWF
jgi:hypothetical protein